MFKSLCSALALATCVACVSGQPTQHIEDRVIGIGFVGGELSRRGGRGVSYSIGIFDEGGLYVICAATKGVRDNVDAQALRALRITMNNQLMMSGLDWAPRYTGANSMNGKIAGCRQTTVGVVANPEFDIQLAKTRFRR